MTRWQVASGILALLLLISFGTCLAVGNVPTYEEDLAAAEEALADAREELQSVKSELTQVKATKEIEFDGRLRVFDIERGYYEVSGRIQNVSDTPISKVVVLVAFYNRDGSLDEDRGAVGEHTVNDLFPQEVAEWKVHFGNWSDQEFGLFDVYAIANRST